MTGPQGEPGRDGRPDEGRPPAPTLADFDEWIRKRVLVSVGLVILVAFLMKAFGPSQFGFTAGLIAGLVLLTAAYLADFYWRRR